MRYDLVKIARSYVHTFQKFLQEKGIDNYTYADRLYSLFSYSLKKIYNMECHEDSFLIRGYGESCIKRLKTIKDVPKNPKRLRKSDKEVIINVCLSYFTLMSEIERGNIIVYERIDKQKEVTLKNKEEL